MKTVIYRIINTLFFVSILLCAYIQIPILAAPINPTLSASSTSGLPGESVAISISVDANSNITGGSLNLRFDNSFLSFDENDFENTGGLFPLSVVLTAPDNIRITFYNFNGPITDERTLVMLTFRILPDSKSGVSELELSVAPGGVTDPSGLINVNTSNGSITILPREAPSVTGRIKSWNPTNPTTIKLYIGEKEEYVTTIESSEESEQPFEFDNVKPGTYTLVVTKEAHAKFSVMNVVVGDEDVNLTEHERDEIKLMRLQCGDMNDDGMINDSDLTILWMPENYNKRTYEADNAVCDLNGDGYINDGDLTILWYYANYNKGGVVCTF